MQDIIYRKINQAQKEKHYMISLLCENFKKNQLTETESRKLSAKGWRKGDWSGEKGF